MPSKQSCHRFVLHTLLGICIVATITGCNSPQTNPPHANDYAEEETPNPISMTESIHEDNDNTSIPFNSDIVINNERITIELLKFNEQTQLRGTNEPSVDYSITVRIKNNCNRKLSIFLSDTYIGDEKAAFVTLGSSSTELAAGKSEEVTYCFGKRDGQDWVSLDSIDDLYSLEGSFFTMIEDDNGVYRDQEEYSFSISDIAAMKGSAATNEASAHPPNETETTYVMTSRSTLLDDYTYSNQKFDDKGNLIEVTETSPDNKIRTNVITFEYTDDGRLITRTDDIRYKELYESYSIITSFDDKGGISEIKSTNPDDSLGVPADFVYFLPAAIFSNVYNANNQLVERSYNNYRDTLEYNHNGQLAKTTTVTPDGEIVTISYEYDNQGNLIKDTVQTSDTSWTNLYTYEEIPIEIEKL